MSVFTQDLVFAEAKDEPSSVWMITLGIVLLIGTVFQEIVGIDLQDSFALISNSTEFFSIYFMR